MSSSNSVRVRTNLIFALVAFFAALVAVVVSPPQSAIAEANATNQGVRGLQTWYVYVAPGDRPFVDFALIGIDGGGKWGDTTAIVVRDPAGAVVFNCTTVGAGCSYAPTSAAPGTYSVSIERAGVLTNPSATLGRNILRWRIEARPSGSATPIPGRVWTDRYVVWDQWGAPSDMTLYYQTRDGFTYRILREGMVGLDSQFTADAFGNVDVNTCASAYRSIPAPREAWGLTAAGYPYAPVRTTPGCNYTPYKIFFQPPATDLPSSVSLPNGETTWLLRNPPAPGDIVVDSFSFVGTTPGARSGQIDFRVPNYEGSVKVLVDVDADSSFTGPRDRTIPVSVTAGEVDPVVFDGLDATGAVIPVATPLAFRVEVESVGEVHFVDSDVEVLSGVVVNRLNGPAAGRNVITWDDQYLTAPAPERVKCSTTTPVYSGAPGAQAAVDSTSGVHGWPSCGTLEATNTGASNATSSGSWGNLAEIDRWASVDLGRSFTFEVPGYEITKSASQPGEAVSSGSEIDFTITADAVRYPPFDSTEESVYTPASTWDASLVDDLSSVADNAVVTSPVASAGTVSAFTAANPGAGFTWSGSGLPFESPVTLNYSATVTAAPADFELRNRVTSQNVPPGTCPTSVCAETVHDLIEVKIVKRVIPEDADIPADPTSVELEALSVPASGWDVQAATASAGASIAGSGELLTSDDGSAIVPITMEDGVSSASIDLSETMRAGYGLQQVTIDGTPQNAVCVGSDDPEPDVTNTGTTASPGISVAAQRGQSITCTFFNRLLPAELRVEKVAEVEGKETSDARPGDVVTYTVTATNTGEAAYTVDNPAVVFDDLSGVLDDAAYNEDVSASRTGTLGYEAPLISWSGALGVGETVDISYSVTLRNGGDGDVSNVTWVPDDPATTTPPLCDPATDGVDDATGQPCAIEEFELPRLTIDKSVDTSELPEIGGQATFTVVVRNAGPGDYTAAAPATASDDLGEVLDDAVFDDASLTADVGTATRDGADLGWSGALAAGEQATITYSVTYTGEGDQILRNLACIPEDETAPGAQSCDQVQVPGALLTQWKTAQTSSEPVVAGSSITYTLFFDNDGQSPAIVDAVDDLTHVLDDAVVTTEPTGSAGLTVGRNGAQISITGSVPVGQTSTVSYTVTVLPDDERGDSDASNFLLQPGETPPTDGECVPTDDEAPNCTTTPITGVTYTKTVEASETPVRTGTELTYTVVVTNTGATTVDVLRDDDLSDVLDDTTLTRAPESNTPSVTVEGPDNGTLAIRGTLAAGATAEVTYTAMVKKTGERGNNVSENFLVTPGNPPADPCDPTTEECTVTPIQGYTLTKSSDSDTTVPGAVVTYTVTVTNVGAVDYTDADPASFEDDLSDVLDDATYNSDVTAGGAVDGDTLAWKGPLPAGASTTVTYSVTVNDPSTGDSVLGNVVVPGDPSGECLPDECGTTTPVASFTVAKSADTATVMAGGVVTYSVIVTNTGQVDYTDSEPASFEDDLTAVLDDATYNDDVSAGGSVAENTLTWSGALAIGDTVTVTYSVTVNDPLSGDRRLVNAVVPSVPGGSCDPEAECTTQTQVASFTVSKESDSATVRPGGVVTYTVTVTNTGEVAYTADDPAAFEDDLSGVLDDAAYNDDASSGATVSGSTLTWSGALAVGETVTVTYSVTADDPIVGDFSLLNAVTPTGPGGSCDVCETNTPVGSYRAVKSTTATEVVPGDVVEYTIEVTNTGQVAYTDDAPASFSDDLSAVLDDATYNGDVRSTSGSGVTYTDPQLGWSGPLGIGEAVTITYSVTVNDPVTGDRRLENTVVTPPGSGANCVEGSTDPDCGANVPAASYSVAKSASSSDVRPGDLVTYTVTVTNTGEVPYTDENPASFEDDLSRVLDDATYNGDVSDGGAVSESVLTWSGPLAVGETVEVTYSVTVDDPITGDFNLRNVVAPTAPGGECLEGECITDTPVSSYTVQKSADVRDVVLGGVVTYTVTVENTGRVAYTADAPASFADDLSGVLDDATYNDDATSGAEVSGEELAWEGPLEIGETVSITYSVTVNEPATGDGTLRNAVIGDAPGGGCSIEGDCVTETPIASYRVTKDVSTPQATIGDRVIFTVTVTNTGQVDYTDARPASFTDDLTSSLAVGEYSGDATNGAEYERPVLSWEGAVAVGESVTVTYSVTVTSTGEIRNLVVTPDGSGANCSAGSTDEDCHTTTTVVPPGLAITGAAPWIAGGVGGAVLLALGLWLLMRRRAESTVGVLEV